MQSAYSDKELLAIINRRVEAAGSQRKLAAELGISNNTIALIVRGEMAVGREMALKLGMAIGYVPVKKGKVK